MERISKQMGFSLIEILISISVLLIVLGGLSSMAVGIIRTSSTNKYQIEAYSLAQKQLELAKQLRNTNNIDGDSLTSWDSDQDGNGIVEGNKYHYQVDMTNGQVSLQPGVGETTILDKEYQYFVGFEYNEDANISDNNYLNLTANISWQELDVDREIKVNSSLTNWYWNYE
jgi:prepilin-type N-terminal cleavage/methylation domain-containing protein